MVEVNVPSRVGGLCLRDVLANEDGAVSFREFLREKQKQQQQRQSRSDDDCDYNAHVKKVDFYSAISEFAQVSNGEVLKQWAQNIFDAHCANNAEKKVELSSNVLADIDAKIFNNDGNGQDEKSSITCTLFNAARQEMITSLERSPSRIFEKYKQSRHFQTHLAKQRTFMKQTTERPTECVLCSVKTGIHAMHPLYDEHGKNGRQLVLPASGPGFMRKERRLAWVHTLCAMFISSSEMIGGLVYGCDEDGECEEDDGKDDEGITTNRLRVIESDDEDEDEELSSLGGGNLEEEQMMFTRCEEVFQPLMKRLQDQTTNNHYTGSSDVNVVNDVLECIESMIEYVQVLTPPFVREYQIGQLIKSVRKFFDEGTYPEVKARCKYLSAEMKRVYNAKEKNVPDGFVPVRNMSIAKESETIGENNNTAVQHDGNGDNDKEGVNDNSCARGPTIDTNDDVVEQKYKIGTVVAKEFSDGNYNGKITNYDSKNNLYRIVYSDGDSEDLNESEVAHLLLTYTAWFCMAAPDDNGDETKASLQIKSLRKLICVVCKKKDNASRNCLRIPVQCSAGDRYEFKEFKKYHRALNKKHKGCTGAMHVGCARWGSDYAKVNNRSLRMCYYFPGMAPTYTGPDEYKEPVSNCFCRVHAREVQEGIMSNSEAALSPAGGTTLSRKLKSLDVAEDSLSDVSSEHESDDSAEKARRSRISISRQKKRKRILEESDEECD